MTRTRDEHLAWCKGRALAILAEGDEAGALASMISDLGKCEPPLYDPLVFKTLALVGMMFCKTASEVRNWIEGYA